MNWFLGISKENNEECDLNSSHYTEKLQKELESFSMVDTDDIVQYKHPFADTYESDNDNNNENNNDNENDNELAPSKSSNDNSTTNIIADNSMDETDNSIDETAQAMIEILERDREQMRVNSKALAKKYDWKNIAFLFQKVFIQMLRK